MRRALLILALLLIQVQLLAQHQIQPGGGSSGTQHVICDSGCGTPPATPDAAAFTAGTTNVSLIAGVFNDALTALTSGKSGAPRITAYRGLHINLRDNSGNELGISSAPVYVAFPSAQAVSGTFWQATQPVSGPLTDTQLRASSVNIAVQNFPTTASSSAVSVRCVNTAGSAFESCAGGGGAGGAILDGVDPAVKATVTASNALKVDGSAVTQPISAASLPLPSGAATSAKQPALGTAGSASADVITVQGIASMTALKVDGSAVTQPVSGTFWQATQPVTANAGTNLNTSALALDATVTGRLPAGTSPADNESNTNTNLSRVGTFNYVYDGTTWDRWTGAVSWTTPSVTSATLTTTTCPGTGCVSLSSVTTSSMLTVGVTGTFTGTVVLKPEISEDGTNWIGTTCTQASTANFISTLTPTSGGYEILWCAIAGQISDARVRVTLAPGTGSVVVRLSASSDPVATPANTVKQGTSAALSSAWGVQITDSTNGPAAVKAASTAAVAADPALVTAFSPNSPLPTGSNTIGALTANQTIDLNRVGGTAVVNGGLAGSQAIGGTAGNNASITQNPILVGLEARSSTPTQATNGNQIRQAGDLAGNTFNVMPIAWTCNLQALANTLTQCQAAPSASYSLYVTSIIVTTTTTTAGTFAIRYGTGSNCATSPIGVWPQPGGSAPSRVTTAPISTALPLVINLGPVGFKVAAANAICVIGVATNTIDISLSGYTAP